MPLSRFTHKLNSWVYWTIPLAAIACHHRVNAQSIVPAQDGVGTVTQSQSNRIDISGGQLSQDGANLFHSFSQFNLDRGQIANFLSQPQIQNILSRINGGEPSLINGVLQVSGGNSNLFLLNPAGIVFGVNASLNLPASFTATTATGINFNNRSFNVFGNNSYADLVGNPTGLSFGNSQPAGIVNDGKLEVKTGEHINLIAGTVVSNGSVNAPQGKINIAAIPGTSMVKISQPGNVLSLEISASEISNFNPVTLPQLLTGGVKQGDVVVKNVNAGTATIAANHNLDLTNSNINTSGNLTLHARDTLVIKDSRENPVQIKVGNRLLMQGDRAIDIFALNNLKSTISAGENLTLRSSNTVSGDAHFDAGGNFTIEDLQGKLGGLFSPYDPVIRASGNVSFQNYTGASLHILAGGSVNIPGTIAITGTDATNGLQETVTLADGKTVNINGRNAPTVDIRAGTTNFGTAGITGGNNGFTPNPPATSNNPTSSSITIGNINFNATDANNPPLVFLTNEYAPNSNLAPGDITVTGTINTANNLTSGDIAIAGRNNVNINQLTTTVNNVTTAAVTPNTGNINILAGGDINATGLITTQNPTNGTSGEINLQAKNSIATRNLVSSSSFGNGGKITLNSGKNIQVGAIDSRGNINGGEVDITASRLFRATDSILVTDPITEGNIAVSIDSNGGQNSGAITIRHEGIGIIPFNIGDAGINGTQNSIISSSNNRILPPQSFRTSYTQGNIQIITGTPPTTEDTTINRPKTPPINPPQTTSLIPPLNPGIGNRDRLITDDFGQLPKFNRNITTQDSQQILQQIESNTGIKPALIYATFAPPHLDLDIAQDSPHLSDAARDNFQLELVMVTPKGLPVRKTLPITRKKFLQIAKQFRKEVTNPNEPDAFLDAAQQLDRWLVAPLESELKQRQIKNLAFIMDAGLRSLPIAALHDGKKFLVERYSVGLMPSLSLTDTRYVDVRNAQVLAMGADKFIDQKPLAAVPVELKTITGKLWQGKSFINEQFTAQNLIAQRQQQPFGIVHLATHGEFKPGGVQNSYIQMWNERLQLDRLRQLQLNQPPVELMVLSACRTALGDEEAELGFAGLANQAGVKSAMGSLWYVSDEGTLGLMTSFYRDLKQAPIKAEALRQAQIAMLEGKIRIQEGKLIAGSDRVNLPPTLAHINNTDLKHPYYWAGFTIVGNPW
jgi:filamentous hemagglutinin family protein